MNIFTNYISNKYITIDDRVNETWMDEWMNETRMNETIKNIAKLKKSLHKSSNFIELQKLSTEVSDIILKKKIIFWNLIIRTTVSKPIDQPKILLQWPSGPIDFSIISKQQSCTDFTKKANLFNDFFATQCTPVNNSNVLPSTVSFKTHSTLSSISFEKEDILKIIRNLKVNKAHGHDDISIRTLKIYDSEIVEPLLLIYKSCIDSGIFPGL